MLPFLVTFAISIGGLETARLNPKRWLLLAVIPGLKKWPEANGIVLGGEAPKNSSNHSLRIPICFDYILVWLQWTATVLGAKNTTQLLRCVKCLTKYNLILLRSDLNGAAFCPQGPPLSAFLRSLLSQSLLWSKERLLAVGSPGSTPSSLRNSSLISSGRFPTTRCVES